MSADSSGVPGGIDPLVVKTLAEARGITTLCPEHAALIARSVTMTCRTMLRTAQRFQRASRRSTMIAEDVDAAIRLTGVSPALGFDTTSRLNYRFAGPLIKDVKIRDDREIELDTLLNKQLPKLPLAPVLRAHWLVIDGKQPQTPDNPISETSQFGNLKISQRPSTSADEPPLLKNLGKRARKTMQVQVKTTTSHAVCLEQQVLFTEILEAVMGNDEQRRTEALSTLQHDCGLQVILARLSLVIAEGVRCNVAQKNLALLIYHMRMVQSLSANKNLSLERVVSHRLTTNRAKTISFQLHELLPSILTCILSKTLGNQGVDNHWVLREFSSKLLYSVCKSYASPSTRVRVIKVLTNVFTNPDTSMTTLCAAVTALTEFGAEVLETTVAPIADQLYQAGHKIIADGTPAEEVPVAQKLLELLAKWRLLDATATREKNGNGVVELENGFRPRQE